MIDAPPLVEHGIFTENSNIRAHVSPTAREIFVFKTADMVKEITENKYVIRPAFQNGVNGKTADGYLVPWKPLLFIRTVQGAKTQWWQNFAETDSLTVKGQKAVKLVSYAIKAGRFPLWANPEEVKDIKIDIAGTDITVSGKWKIQVKCDYNAGITGNLYIQFEECNPLKNY